MALSDLQVFQEFTQTTMTEVQDQQVEIFNQANRGGIILTSGSYEGDYSTESFWKKIDGLVRVRNPYGSGAVTAKTMSQGEITSVKVARGTPPVTIDPGMFRWIQKNPQEAGVVLGQQLAGDRMREQLNTAIMIYIAAISGQSSLVNDATSGTATLSTLVGGAAKFGDRSQDIVSWVMHSKSLFDIYNQALQNNNRLFDFGNIQVIEDGFGRPLVITDSPNLIDATPNPDQYYQLGLTQGAVVVELGNEFEDNIQTNNGDENIGRTYQAEWAYNLGVKGFTWDRANGGKAPTNAALATSTNWDKTVTSDKDLAGVLVKTL